MDEHELWLAYMRRRHLVFGTGVISVHLWSKPLWTDPLPTAPTI